MLSCRLDYNSGFHGNAYSFYQIILKFTDKQDKYDLRLDSIWLFTPGLLKPLNAEKAIILHLLLIAAQLCRMPFLASILGLARIIDEN